MVRREGSGETAKMTLTSKLRKISAGVRGQKVRSAWRWGAFLALLLILSVVILVATSRVLFHVRDSAGRLCQSSSSASPIDGRKVIKFYTSEPCKPTGVTVVAGTTYRFGVKVLSPWKDGSLPANPDGLENVEPLKMKFFRPLRRHIRRPWFELTGRVGRGEAFTIGAGTCYTPKSDGELYFYVNDAVSGFLPGKWWAFSYFWQCGRNCGTACITVTEVGQSSTCNREDRCGVCTSPTLHFSTGMPPQLPNASSLLESAP